MSLAKIHIAKKDLGLDDATYRALLERVTGKTSSAAMTPQERGKMLDEFRRLGWKPGAPRRRGLDGPYAAKVQALWIAGWNLGLIRNRDDKALIAFVKRQTGIDHTRWVRQSDDAAKVIEALKGWLARDGGVDWSTYDGMPDYARNAGFKIAAAQWDLLARKATRLPGEDRSIKDLSELQRRVAFRRFCLATAAKDLFAQGEVHPEADWIPVMNALGEQLRPTKRSRRAA